MDIPKLSDYRAVVDGDVVEELYVLASQVGKRSIKMVNSTAVGGGVAEMLHRLVPLLNELGVQAKWEVIKGGADFFDITKRFHNALQGERLNLTQIKKELYVEANQDFSSYTHIDHDCVIIHDPQPLPLIRFYRFNC